MSWPYDFRAILSTAFGSSPQPAPEVCKPQGEFAAGTIAGFQSALELTDVQTKLLKALGDALDIASGSLAESCPKNIPTQPIARLELIESQVGKINAALSNVRQPLQEFQHSLNNEQLARFAAMIGAPSAADDQRTKAARCTGATATAVDWPADQIERSIQPIDTQRDAFSRLKEALGKAAGALNAPCLTPMPVTELGRLEMTKTQLDATKDAVAAIRLAFSALAVTLSDEQKARLDSLRLSPQ